MALDDWPWVSILGVLVPLASLAWRISIDRGTRFVREVDQFDLAIDRATKRKDPLQYVYRAALFQRLYRVHQRDKTSRALGSAIFWALYAALFFGLGISSAVVDDQAVAGAAFLATLISFSMATRAVARYQDGMLEREPQAVAAYVRALSNARQKFIAAVPKSSKQASPIHSVWKRFRTAWKRRLPKLREGLHLLAVGVLITLGLYWWFREAPGRTYLTSWCTSAVCIGVTWLLMSGVHAKLRQFFAWLVAPVVAPMLDWAARLTMLTVLCWPLSAWLAEMATTTDVPLWGWALDLAALELLAGMALSVRWRSKQMGKPAANTAATDQ